MFKLILLVVFVLHTCQVEGADRSVNALLGEPTVEGLDDCKTDQGWNAGWGECVTYGRGNDFASKRGLIKRRNFKMCDRDCDDNGVCASEACSQCEKCNHAAINWPVEHFLINTAPSNYCKSGRDWNAGWGDCYSYAEGQINHKWCTSSTDYYGGDYAYETCAECGICEPYANYWSDRESPLTSGFDPWAGGGGPATSVENALGERPIPSREPKQDEVVGHQDVVEEAVAIEGDSGAFKHEFVHDLAILLIIGGALFGCLAYNSSKKEEENYALLTEQPLEEI